ncbi:hypothetical protein [Cystobacter fuscus]|uniref:hypothetical protein n=1 Tax=Cystobacter fuscus TaxID=43 RepID=UPI0037BE8FAB
MMSRTWSMLAAMWLMACGTQAPSSERSPSPAQDEVSPRQEWEGELEVFVEDSPSLQKSRLKYVLDREGQRRPVVFSRGEPEGLRSGARLKLRGREMGHQFLAEEVEVERHAEALPAAAGTCGVMGEQRALVILAAFPGMPRPANTVEATREIFFSTTRRSLAGYWREVSEGRTTTTGDVEGWYTLDRAYSCNETEAMRDAALRAANADVDFTRYDRVFIVHPRPQEGCSYSGQASLSCGTLSTPDGTVTASSAWLVAEELSHHDRAVELVTHEAGHNLSLGHARSRDFGAEPLGYLGTPGTVVEYGDVFSTMGAWNLGHYTAPHKARIGWLDAASVAQVEGEGGTFTLAPVVSSGGLKALKVRRGATSGGWLWLEYHQPLGAYEGTLDAQVFGGALVHYEDAETRESSDLLDFTPETASWSDPVLRPGRTWNDPYSTLSVTVESATAAGLTVSVRYAQKPCVRALPQVKATPLSDTVSPGGQPEFELALTNPDSAGCGPSTFQLAPIIPSGWSADPLPSRVTVAASSTASLTLQTYVPYRMEPGLYTAGVAVTRDGYTVEGTSTVKLVERCIQTPPTLMLSPATRTAAPGSAVTWTVNVTNNDSASCDWVWYDFVSTLPSAWETTWSEWGVNLPPGGAFTFTMTKSIPTSAWGSHTVDLNLYQEDFGLAASTTATVVVE